MWKGKMRTIEGKRGEKKVRKEKNKGITEKQWTGNKFISLCVKHFIRSPQMKKIQVERQIEILVTKSSFHVDCVARIFNYKHFH